MWMCKIMHFYISGYLFYLAYGKVSGNNFGNAADTSIFLDNVCCGPNFWTILVTTPHNQYCTAEKGA